MPELEALIIEELIIANQRLRAEIEALNKSAVSAFARLGGQSKSEAKKAASRINGKKGGRPRKKQVNPN